MRDFTKEEANTYNDILDSLYTTTGISFYDYIQNSTIFDNRTIKTSKTNGTIKCKVITR